MIWLSFVGYAALLIVLLLLVRKLFQYSGSRKKITNKSLRKSKYNRNRKIISDDNKQFSCAFFHPNCSAGGGGERTLYAAILSIKANFPNAKLLLFIKANTKNQNSLAEIRKKALDDFNLDIPDDLILIPLKTGFLAESKTWPRFTLLGQIVGSLALAFEAMVKVRPDALIDTAGFPFIYPIVKLFKCRLIAYVHYPFISNDMIQKLRTKSFNNSAIIASNSLLQNAKIFYYKYMQEIYSLCGKCCDLAFTNSTWTNGHMVRLWNQCSSIKILYPPCDLSPFTERIKLEQKMEIQVLSLSQFRPEKNHRLQLEIAAQVLKHRQDIKFIFVGGCRGVEDESRVNELKQYANDLKISDHVQFKLNLPFDELLETLQVATIGLHTMTDEHFGIGIVELMAAGLITIAHNSGGPRADIIEKDIGFLCASTSEYSEIILKIASMSDTEKVSMSARARASVLDRFSGEIFSKKFSKSVRDILSQ